MKGKKGSSAGSDVSILIVIIAMLVMIYVILLPPEERGVLLNETSAAEEAEASGLPAKVLLSESPGTVFSYSTNVQTIGLEPVHVYSKESTSTSTLVRALYVNRNFLLNGYKEIYFDLPEAKSLKSLKLIMLIAESKGPVSIFFNEQLVYEGQLTSAQMPLTLPLNLARETNNKVELSIPMPWWKLTSSYYYSLQDIGLIKETKEEKPSSVRSFSVDKELSEQVNSAELRYYLSCNTVEEHGRLTIRLDGRAVHSDTIFCQYTDERVVPLPKEQFKGIASHRLEFRIDKGDYSIDEPRVKVKLARSTYPSYVFDVDSALWEKLSSGDAKVKLYFKFKDDGTRKKARVLVQDKEFSFDTTKGTYSKDITSMLDDGSNVVKIVPHNTFELNNMKVYWE